MFYVYIIHSNAADKYYTGYSEDPWERIKHHNENDSEKYTGKYKDWSLAAVFEAFNDRGETMQLEKFIKPKLIYGND